MSGGRRTFTRKADWVYRPDAFVEGGDPDELGTYDSSLRTVVSGQAGRAAFCLYDSQNVQLQRMTSVAANYLRKTGRAEGRAPLMLRVQGHMYLEPTIWAVGNIIAQGFRILIEEQDPVTGLMIQNSSYSMWAGVAGSHPAMFANEKNYMYDARIYKVFNLNSDSHRDWRIDVRMRRRLQPHQALWLYTEGESTGVNVRLQMYLRTLVVDEG